MKLNLYEILPEELSDEAAAHLADIFMRVALAIETFYYPQIKRHIKATSQEREEPF